MFSELKSKIFKLLKEDEEFRYAVAGLLGLEELLKRMDENSEAIRALQEQVKSLQGQVEALQRQVVENTEAIRSLQKQVEEHSRVIRSLQEQVVALQGQVKSLQEQVKSLQEQVVEHSKAIRALQGELAEHSRSLEKLTRSIQALGARWGLLAEEAFRSGMRGLVERYFGGRVSRWVRYDEEGFVFGRPCVVEADLVVRDGEHILVEVKSSVSRADVFELWRVGRLYEKMCGVKPRLAVVSPFVEDKAREAAEELGIDVYTGL